MKAKTKIVLKSVKKMEQLVGISKAKKKNENKNHPNVWLVQVTINFASLKPSINIT